MNIDECLLTEIKKEGQENKNKYEYVYFYSGIKKNEKQREEFQ